MFIKKAYENRLKQEVKDISKLIINNSNKNKYNNNKKNLI